MKAVPAERSNGLTGTCPEQLAAEMRQRAPVGKRGTSGSECILSTSWLGKMQQFFGFCIMKGEWGKLIRKPVAMAYWDMA